MKRLLPILFAAPALCACGILYTNVRVPRAYRTAVPSEVKASPEDPVVVGTACVRSLLYLVAWGDSGYSAAAKEALKEHPDRLLYDVKSDVHVRSILLGLYSRTCTRLSGRAAKP
jgi:hypothetical protein